MYFKLSTLFAFISLAYSDDSTLCADSSESFTTTRTSNGVEETITVTCNWVKNSKNRRWKCKKLSNVATNCPSTCESCVTAAPSPSSTPGGSSMYPWCKDSTKKFEINSLKWIKSKKSCAWATEDGKQWFRCSIEEVQENCPVLCDFCQCKKYEGRFTVAPGMRKTCEWAEKQNTLNRCRKYPVLKTMCPLSCDLCIPSVQPSSVPTLQPSAQPFINLYNSGHARVFTFDSSIGQWTKIGQDLDGENTCDSFGYSVSISSDGRTVAIGASLRGYVNVYSFDESIEQWTQLGEDIVVGDEQTVSHIVSLSSDGRTVAISVPFINDRTGVVRVYSFDSTAEQWTQLGQELEGETAREYFGQDPSPSYATKGRWWHPVV